MPSLIKNSNLFKPLQIGNVTLQNRVVLAPMARGRVDSDFTLEDIGVIYYEQRSRRPGSLIITEATTISEKVTEPSAGIFAPKHYAVWKKVIDTVHSNKSFIFIQLWTPGALSDPVKLKERGLPYESASDDVYINETIKQKAIDAGNPVHGLTKEEIKSCIDDFVKAAKKAVELGADGVEINVAHGNMLFQFLYDGLNHRNDEYGGSTKNKTRFLLELIDTLGEAIGSSRVAIRISPGFSYDFHTLFPIDDRTFDQYTYIIKQLEQRRIEGKELAYLHVTEPFPDHSPVIKDNDEFLVNYNGVVIRASRYIETPEKTLKDLEHYEKTAIAYGRYFISNPDLANRLENEYELTPYKMEAISHGGKFNYIDQAEYNKDPEF